ERVDTGELEDLAVVAQWVGIAGALGELMGRESFEAAVGGEPQLSKRSLVRQVTLEPGNVVAVVGGSRAQGVPEGVNRLAARGRSINSWNARSCSIVCSTLLGS